jgi:hypothetical protein
VDGIGIVRYPDAISGQLLAKAYRSRTGDRRGFVECSDPLGQILRAVDGWLPDPLPGRRVKRGKDLAAPAVEDRQPLPLRPDLADPDGKRVEGADPTRRQAEAERQPAGGRDPHPQAGERPRPEADGDQVDALPAARRRGRPLDLLEQAGRMEGPPLRGEPQLRLVEDLAVAPAAGDGVDRRGVEADDVQSGATR